MKVQDLFENWGLKSIKVNSFGLADLEFSPEPIDQEAAWELYVELVTRITTQELEDETGVEESALGSVRKIFEITRDILKTKGRKCTEFSKIAIVMLNEIIRPFTSKWHKLKSEGFLENEEGKRLFRSELRVLQTDLRKVTFMLSQIAKVKDSTDTKTLKDTSYMERYMK